MDWILRLAFVVILAASGPLWADTRVALVIGNAKYEHAAHLPNAANDASDIGEALERIGFTVTRGFDLDYRSMRLLLRDFARIARNAEMVVIYFAGHGIEIDSTNYLIPANAELRSDQDIEFETVRLDVVLNATTGSNGLKMVLVDACRNNPFLVSMERSSATRSIGRGLARVDPGGVLVGYAARSGTLALDGNGRNSPYARAILTHIEEPGLEIGKMFRKVRDTVYSLTEGYQEPFTYGSLPGEDIFLVPAVLKQSLSEEIALAYAKAETAGTQAAWTKFLDDFEEFGDHPLRSLAQQRLAALVVPDPTVEDRSVVSDELEAFAAAEKLGSARGWALYFSKFPAGEMKRSALLQEDAAFMNTLRDRVWGRYRDISLGQRMTPEMRAEALGMIRVDPSQVTRIQNALSFARIDVGGIDGKLGPRTRQALEQFQLGRSLPPTGLPTRATLAALQQTGNWSTTGRLEFTPEIYPTSGAIARIPDPPAIRILEQDPRLDRAIAALPGREIVYGFFEGRLYLATNLGTTFGRSELADIEGRVGGRLVEIGSPAEEAFIRELVRFDLKLWGTTSIRSNLGPGIGLQQRDGRWGWRSGASLTYRNWAPGEPKRLPEGSPLDESYGRLVPLDRAQPKHSRVERIGWASSPSLPPIIILEIE